jgi:hypothetical protein
MPSLDAAILDEAYEAVPLLESVPDGAGQDRLATRHSAMRSRQTSPQLPRFGIEFVRRLSMLVRAYAESPMT